MTGDGRSAVPSKWTWVWMVAVVALLASGLIPRAHADNHVAEEDRSPAECGSTDVPEPGIQGDVPSGETANYNCGLTPLGVIDGLVGAVQGNGECAYVRSGESVFVVDVSHPTRPEAVGDVAVAGSSETMRVVVTDDRAVLVSGSSIYDVSDCRNPVHKGDIPWPSDGLPWPWTPTHDLRVSHDGTTVYGSFGLKVADIADLEDSSSWTVDDETCHVHAQYDPVHAATYGNGASLCDQGYFPGPGTGELSHGPDDNLDGTRIYTGGQVNQEEELYILDATTEQPTLIARVPNSPGHSIDYFRTADGREFLLHANEGAPQRASPIHRRRHLCSASAQAASTPSSPTSPTRPRPRGRRS